MLIDLSLSLQFEYQEGAIPLRFLRLKHDNVRQNITYSCDSGVDSFMLVQLLGGNGDVISFNDKTVRMISQVRYSEPSDYETGMASLPRQNVRF